jgi:tetratricopeptide (TPR) repeat protein
MAVLAQDYRPSDAQLQKVIRQSVSNGYTYLSNHKVASSTIKQNLWQHSRLKGEVDFDPKFGELHRQAKIWDTDFQELDGSTFVFSFVRNPFTRILSCYMDKMIKPNLIKSSFCEKHGYAVDHQISFLEFLRAISGDRAEVDNHHWRPQHRNLLVGIVPINFVGFIEHFAEHFDVVSKRLGLLGVQDERRPHRTNASSVFGDYYTEEAIQLVRSKYALDFELFGYSTDISQINPLDKAPRQFTSVTDRQGNIYVNCVGQYRREPEKVVERLAALRSESDFTPSMYQVLYQALRRTGHEQQAEDVVEECFKRYPDDEISLFIRAKHFAGKKDFARALVASQGLYRVEPRNPSYVLMHVRILLKNRDINSALETAQSAAKFGPYEVISHIALATAQLSARRKGDARATLAHAETLVASPYQKRQIERLQQKAEPTRVDRIKSWFKLA